jgi:hypothetical protein
MRAPLLFSPLLNFRPKSFAPSVVKKMHAQFEGECRDVLREVAQVELPPIEAEFLKRRSYVAKAREMDPHQTMGNYYDFAHSFGVFNMRGDDLVVSLYYDVDGLSRCQGPTSAVMVHEIAGTVYGKQIEALQRGALRAVSSKETILSIDESLSAASGGWAQLFGQTPYELPELLALENSYHHLDRLPGEARTEFLRALRYGPNFVSIALLKIEMAFGFPRVLALLREIPGIKNPRLGQMEGTLEEFWTQYDRANRLLGIPSIPYAEFCGGAGPTSGLSPA